MLPASKTIHFLITGTEGVYRPFSVLIISRLVEAARRRNNQLRKAKWVETGHQNQGSDKCKIRAERQRRSTWSEIEKAIKELLAMMKTKKNRKRFQSLQIPSLPEYRP